MLYYFQVKQVDFQPFSKIFRFATLPAMKEYTIISNSSGVTFKLGKRMGERLRAGIIVALTGELGCGKTVLTRGICDGLDVPLRQVNSPTFVLANEYRGRLPVFHMDMYQVSTESDAIEMGIIDYLARAAEGVMVVEWAERILPLLPPDLLKVNLTILSENKRQIDISAGGQKSGVLLKELNNKH
jgi:tRNA threonylcarbamoyladenosine biosynthesis protein TsaE